MELFYLKKPFNVRINDVDYSIEELEALPTDKLHEFYTQLTADLICIKAQLANFTLNTQKKVVDQREKLWYTNTTKCLALKKTSMKILQELIRIRKKTIHEYLEDIIRERVSTEEWLSLIQEAEKRFKESSSN